MKIDRLLATTVLLLNRRKITAKELAERFEISVRTVYRDIEALNNAGIPVISLQGYAGGFAIPENYKLSKQLLSFEDMLSILTTLKGLNKTLQNADLQRVVEKIEVLIPEEKEPIYQEYADSFVIDIDGWCQSTRLQEGVKMVQEAVAKSHLLRFCYTDASGKRSKRLVEPHRLILKNFSWYMLGWCRERKAFRLFRLSRMRSLIKTQDPFLRRDLGDFNSSITVDSRPSVELVLHFSSRVRVRVEDFLDSRQLQEQDDGSLIATFGLPEDNWIYSFILSFGSDVEVLSPLRVRKVIQKKCVAMQNMYINLT